MQIDLKREWSTIAKSELKPGDLFFATMGNVKIVALLGLNNQERFAVVLGYEGEDADLDKYPPPATRTMGSISNKVHRFEGKTFARITTARGSEKNPAFPVIRASLEHGDLMIDKDNACWIFANDYVIEGANPDLLLINIDSGQITESISRNVKHGGGVTPDWVLGGKLPDGTEQIFCKFGK